jgi:hypothetical protein
MSGICTSAIKHAVSFSQSDSKNSLAVANALAFNPNDLTNPWVASRTDSSSSTMETMGMFGT